MKLIPNLFLQSGIKKGFFKFFFNFFKKEINIYDMLGVNKDTSEEDIKKAIIKLVNNTNPDNKNSILLKIEEYFATPKDKRDLKYFDLFKFIGFGFNTETKGWLEGNNCDIIKN